MGNLAQLGNCEKEQVREVMKPINDYLLEQEKMVGEAHAEVKRLNMLIFELNQQNRRYSDNNTNMQKMLQAKFKWADFMKNVVKEKNLSRRLLDMHSELEGERQAAEEKKK